MRRSSDGATSARTILGSRQLVDRARRVRTFSSAASASAIACAPPAWEAPAGDVRRAPRARSRSPRSAALEREQRVRREAGEERAGTLGRERDFAERAGVAKRGHAERASRRPPGRATQRRREGPEDELLGLAPPSTIGASSAGRRRCRRRGRRRRDRARARPRCRRRADGRRAAGGSTHGTSSAAQRKKGESRPIGWIAEHRSCRKPGSVSSAVRTPPPIASAASKTSTREPCPLQRERAREPFGPEPTTIAPVTGRFLPAGRRSALLIRAAIAQAATVVGRLLTSRP
jgi:hypothetical protein